MISEYFDFDLMSVCVCVRMRVSVCKRGGSRNFWAIHLMGNKKLIDMDKAR